LMRPGTNVLTGADGRSAACTCRGAGMDAHTQQDASGRSTCKHSPGCLACCCKRGLHARASARTAAPPGGSWAAGCAHAAMAPVAVAGCCCRPPAAACAAAGVLAPLAPLACTGPHLAGVRPLRYGGRTGTHPAACMRHLRRDQPGAQAHRALCVCAMLTIQMSAPPVPAVFAERCSVDACRPVAVEQRGRAVCAVRVVACARVCVREGCV
jgi:hypothetical protein